MAEHPAHDPPDPSAQPARVTHRTIAEQLGVSQSAVSLTLSGKGEGRVAPEQRARIRALAEQLGYTPNQAARTLRLGRSHVLALLVPQVDNPFFAPVYLGAEQVAREQGYALALVHTDDRRPVQEHLLSELAGRSIDGFVVWRAPAPENVAALQRRLVLVEEQHPGLPSVVFDIAGAVGAAIGHLRELGHRRIAHLAGDLEHPSFHARRAAVVRALEPAGHAAAPLEIGAADAAARRLLAGPRRPTAIFCDDDLLAIGAYRAAAAAGLRIPADLSVVSLGGTALAEACIPPLTAAALPARDLGARAVTLLLRQLAGQPPDSVTLPASMRVGGSAAPPP